MKKTEISIGNYDQKYLDQIDKALAKHDKEFARIVQYNSIIPQSKLIKTLAEQIDDLRSAAG